MREIKQKKNDNWHLQFDNDMRKQKKNFINKKDSKKAIFYLDKEEWTSVTHLAPKILNISRKKIGPSLYEV